MVCDEESQSYVLDRFRKTPEQSKKLLICVTPRQAFPEPVERGVKVFQGWIVSWWYTEALD